MDIVSFGYSEELFDLTETDQNLIRLRLWDWIRISEESLSGLELLSIPFTQCRIWHARTQCLLMEVTSVSGKRAQLLPEFFSTADVTCKGAG